MHTGIIRPGEAGGYNILVVYGKGEASGRLPLARLRAAGLGGFDTGFLAQANEFSNRFDPEVLHDPAVVDLDRFVGNTQLRGDLLVQHAGDHVSHNFVLSRGQR